MNLPQKILNKLTKTKNRLVCTWLERRYGGKKIIKQTAINGCEMLVMLGDKLGRQIIALKKFEASDTDFLKETVRPDWISIDIGANIGYYSLLLAKLSPAGMVYAFEPNEFDFFLIKINAALNGFKNLEALNQALSSQASETEFCLTEDSGFSSFKNTGRKKISQFVKVRTETMDDFVKSRGLKRIDFIKMDVEGAEKLILAGAAEVLAKIKPALLMIEICEENLAVFGESGRSVLSFLANFGYQPFVISQGELKKFTGNSFGRSPNIYFLPADQSK